MIMVLRLEPQTLLTVVAPTELGMPAPIDACLAGAWPSWKDPRIKAALLLSPYVAPYQLKQTLGGVSSLPLMYQGAQFDIFITPSLEGPSGAYALAQPPKYFAKLFLGSHFEWTNLLCLGTNTIANCMRTKSNAALIDIRGSGSNDTGNLAPARPWCDGTPPGAPRGRPDPRIPPNRPASAGSCGSPWACARP